MTVKDGDDGTLYFFITEVSKQKLPWTRAPGSSVLKTTFRSLCIFTFLCNLTRVFPRIGSAPAQQSPGTGTGCARAWIPVSSLHLPDRHQEGKDRSASLREKLRQTEALSPHPRMCQDRCLRRSHSPSIKALCVRLSCPRHMHWLCLSEAGATVLGPPHPCLPMTCKETVPSKAEAGGAPSEQPGQTHAKSSTKP